MCDLGVSEEDAKTHTSQSSKKIYPTCPYCNRKKSMPMTISSIYATHSIACICGDGFSYCEKFMYEIFTQLNINFIIQLNKTHFEWCNNLRYDFYFELNNEKYIIETHGEQHYEDTKISRNKGRTLQQEKENDNLKEYLAKENNINNYIIIDCRKSELEWIKNNVLSSKLSEIFDLNNINWLKCNEFAISNLCKDVCEIKRSNPNINVEEISKITKLSKTTIRRYLNKGNELGWCSYDSKKEQLKGASKSGKMNGKPIEVFKDGINLGSFESARELERQSKELFGVKLEQSGIWNVCSNKKEKYKGYYFKYLN